MSDVATIRAALQGDRGLYTTGQALAALGRLEADKHHAWLTCATEENRAEKAESALAAARQRIEELEAELKRRTLKTREARIQELEAERNGLNNALWASGELRTRAESALASVRQELADTKAVADQRLKAGVRMRQERDKWKREAETDMAGSMAAVHKHRAETFKQEADALREALEEIKFEAHPASNLSAHNNVQALVNIVQTADAALAATTESGDEQ